MMEHDVALGDTLSALLRLRIASDGPMPLSEYMALCLAHPRFGYYTRRNPLGRSGDFITAPDISQMFGEILGVWLVEAWRQLGEPEPLRLVELGPGRGTLMADMVRVLRKLLGNNRQFDVHLVEISPVLRSAQNQQLSKMDVSIEWHDQFTPIPDGPFILIANEFLDALPIRQFERRDGRWHERMVGINQAGGLSLGLNPVPVSGGAGLDDLQQVTDGAIFELCDPALSLVREVAQRLRSAPGAALFIDYGHAESGFGSTLQAVKNHRYADPFEEPGAADLTAHVDFAAIAKEARAAGVRVGGPIEQGAFLTALGIGERAHRLRARKSPDVREDIDQALTRLVDRAHMGQLFKALCLSPMDRSAMPPFHS